MSRTKFIFILTIVLVLGAGVVVGRLWANLPVIRHDQDKGDWAADVLKLRPEQKTLMETIWDETHQKINETFEQRKTLDRERDQAIAALLSPEQYISYEEIQQEYRDERGNLDKARRKLIHDAEERTKALLDPDQLMRWNEMSQHHAGEHGPASRPGGPGPGFGFGGPLSDAPHSGDSSGEH